MDLEHLVSADQVFDALGGSRGIADLTGTKLSRVSNWRAFGSFPPIFYVVMTDALRARGKTAPGSLWRMRACEVAE